MNVFGEFEHEGNTLTGLEYQGRPAFLLFEAEALLGYAPKTLAKKVRVYMDDGELVEGEDFRLLKGSDLRALKSVVPRIGTRQNRAMLLFESGLTLLAMLAKTEVGRQVRLKIRREIMPAFKQLQAEAEQPKPRPIPEPGDLKSMREHRLARAQRAKGLLLLAKTCGDPEKALAYKRQAGEVLVGEPVAVQVGGSATPPMVTSKATAEAAPKGYWRASRCCEWVMETYEVAKELTTQRWGNVANATGAWWNGERALGLRMFEDTTGQLWVKRDTHLPDGTLTRATFYSPRARKLIVERLQSIGFIGAKRGSQLDLGAM